jgi:hypothetical protein
MNMSLCGECHVCCLVLDIKKSDGFYKDKPIGELCKYVANNQCSIYENKPSVCSKFKCFWLQAAESIKDLPEIWRPDFSNIIVTSHNIDDKPLVKIIEVKAGSIDLSRPGHPFFDFIYGVVEKQNPKPAIAIKQYGKDVSILKRKLII